MNINIAGRAPKICPVDSFPLDADRQQEFARRTLVVTLWSSCYVTAGQSLCKQEDVVWLKNRWEPDKCLKLFSHRFSNILTSSPPLFSCCLPGLCLESLRPSISVEQVGRPAARLFRLFRLNLRPLLCIKVVDYVSITRTSSTRHYSRIVMKVNTCLCSELIPKNHHRWWCV